MVSDPIYFHDGSASNGKKKKKNYKNNVPIVECWTTVLWAVRSMLVCVWEPSLTVPLKDKVIHLWSSLRISSTEFSAIRHGDSLLQCPYWLYNESWCLAYQSCTSIHIKIEYILRFFFFVFFYYKTGIKMQTLTCLYVYIHQKLLFFLLTILYGQQMDMEQNRKMIGVRWIDI